MFVDQLQLELIAGKGGNGVIAWRREKYIPKGGPCGGDGGKGGSIIVQADTQVYSLDAYRNRRILKAENGEPGGSNLKNGKNGKDLLIKVPCGTLVKDAASGEILRDMTEDGDKWVICQGGKGGFGNDHFKSPTQQAPYKCTQGREGESCKVELELKLIADVGLVGFPNAGKSSLIWSLSKVKVKVAPYPFTTLQPNLGFIEVHEGKRIYLADIPGIIEGAHKNKGLGLEFLRHVERTKLLLFILDASGIDGRTPLDDFRVLKAELKKYNPEMAERPFLVALNKIDDETSAAHVKEFLKKGKLPKEKLFQISALTGEGLSELVAALVQKTS
jgi:GTP-binding protein